MATPFKHKIATILDMDHFQLASMAKSLGIQTANERGEQRHRTEVLADVIDGMSFAVFVFFLLLKLIN
jgi:hypothetical protein